jgi:hypothetical protein
MLEKRLVVNPSEPVQKASPILSERVGRGGASRTETELALEETDPG